MNELHISSQEELDQVESHFSGSLYICFAPAVLNGQRLPLTDIHFCGNCGSGALTVMDRGRYRVSVWGSCEVVVAGSRCEVDCYDRSKAWVYTDAKVRVFDNSSAFVRSHDANVESNGGRIFAG